jgi:hypothetical protein
LPPTTKLKGLVATAKQRWIIERDYEELKQELGLFNISTEPAPGDPKWQLSAKRICISWSPVTLFGVLVVRDRR